MTVIVWWIEDKFCYYYATGYWKVVQDRTECSSHNSPSEAGELAEYSWFRYSKCKGLLGKWWTFHLPNYRGNWDKDILPSYRTSDRKTLSLHLFNMYAILDRVVFPPENYEGQTDNIEPAKFIPWVSEQEQLMQELCFVISTSIIENHPQMNELLKRVYPKHLEHTYSRYIFQICWGENNAGNDFKLTEMDVHFSMHVFRNFVIEDLKAMDNYFRNI